MTDRPLALAFLSARKESSQGAAEELEKALQEAFLEGQSAWPGVVLEPLRFASFLGQATHGQADPKSCLAATRTTELYLTCACAQGHAKALALFEERYLSKVDPALRRVGLSHERLEEAKQALRHKLLVVDENGKAATISQYAGRGPLEAWVTVAATRTALNLLRSTVQAVALEGRELESLASSCDDPELRYLKEQHRRDFLEAFKSAIDALADREQHLLKLHYCEGLSTTELGKLYRVHQTTAAQWLSKARQSILSLTKQRLRERLQLDQSECESVINLVSSRLDMTLRRFLTRGTRD